MNIILLSGGSGKRLWPLSNSARSKQFLRLLKSPTGQLESMLQRIVRQIDEAHLSDCVTIATNASQKDSILNQLGERVQVVLEPERRDTFPAIVLSSMYLLFERHCSPEEIVVVMPCDPYTEIGYFETIGRMVQVVEKNEADMALMGVCPTEPSSKFGYIVPCTESSEIEKDVYKVARFTEKPTPDVAKELLKQGAFWNGGVFAFRLGYLEKIVKKYLSVSTFQELSNRYTELPKISFDYEVVEKAESIAVIPFQGKWKDLGTWDVLCQELSEKSLGLVKMQDCLNTHVVNELEQPIVCVGTSDLIVAATPDGILVADKQNTGNLKNVVADLSNRPMFEERRWGSYLVLHQEELPDGCQILTKYLRIHSGKNISYQIHLQRTETWNIVDGDALIVIEDEVRKVHRGDVIFIPAAQKHAIYALSNLIVLELQTGTDLTDDTMQRFEWDWTPYITG